MRALVFDGKTLTLDRVYRTPEVRVGEALIMPTAVGVCSTDLEITRGYMGFTGVLGHEFVGKVVEVHRDDTEVYGPWVGKRVVGSINCACVHCDLCEAGLPTHCRHRTVLGIQGRDGCFSDRFLLPIQNLHEVPDSVDDDHAVFTEPLAAACQVLRQIWPEPHQSVMVLGGGRLGMLVAQALARVNPNVQIVGRDVRKLAVSEKWGIQATPLSEVVHRNDQDIVIDCTGNPSGMTTAMQLVRPRGKIVLKTTTMGTIGVNPAPLVIHEIELIGSRCGPFPDALKLLQANAIDVLSLISRRMKLEDGIAAVRCAAQPGVFKVLMEL